MLKKEIKTFFKAVSDGDIDTVKRLISENNEYLSITNFSPPKKDDGQSPLQVAFKTGNFEIASFLIDNGADVNFIETSEINEWTAPVIHDCLRSIIFNSYTFEKEQKKYNKAISLLSRMIELGADVNACDSYGNNCLFRALSDSYQALDHPDTDFTDEILLSQLRAVFKLLLENGADPKKEKEGRGNSYDLMESRDLTQYNLFQ